MKAFNITTKIFEYATIKEFVDDVKLDEDDLILTSKHTFDHLNTLEIKSKVIFPRKYGDGEPTDKMINELLKETSECNYKRLIAIGGGSILDISKLVAVSNKDDDVDSLFDNKDSLKKNCELILIPTTCGTGSEVTNISVVNRLSKGTKMGLACDALYGDKAILIPQLLETIPYQVFATSSIDAFVHAVESYLSPNRSSLSVMFSQEAIATILNCWSNTEKNGDFKTIASDYLRASLQAGIGFGYAGCAAVHACAYPLGAVHHIAHGQSNQLMFAAVMNKYKQMQPQSRIKDLEKLIAKILKVDESNALKSLYELMDAILPLKPLKEFDVGYDELVSYSQSVIEQQQRLLKNNCIPLSQEDILDIYKKAY